ncbi:MAG: hypothetical protein OK439_03710, partial [Thaumarchaeota archaeon]|nr:hypothetical protein [Nitrososphaerota archaeon]
MSVEPTIEFDRWEILNDLKNLRDSNKFSEFMIMIWGFIEQETDWAVDVAFGVPPDDWIEFVIDRSF